MATPFGLDHQDTNFDNPNLGTCTDNTRDPSTNQHPNQHDYDELALIYGHLDSTTTLASAAAGASDAAGAGLAPAAWGQLVAVTNHGQGAMYIRDLGRRNLIVTHVFWAA